VELKFQAFLAISDTAGQNIKYKLKENETTTDVKKKKTRKQEM
jgi:hypothetical protein